MKRNAYIEYSVWNTVYNIDQQYAGGKYAIQSDGIRCHNGSRPTSCSWAWISSPGSRPHIPRMEDWRVMSTEWKTIHIEPHNFFAHNPALTIRNAK
ncbi:primary-amine oxidase [Rhizobium tibeticum]|uniref:Amine oxidase n=1 Tax=Rhizobium tibeticum TaxID=501024 RepID=A0A1H8L3J3_9HYPH|nr:hypothetical protein [Rhizobium tibeticum]SEH86025.1 tyramine oxidase [Rhizobium tibeticum]SEN99695.1 primary-amine oxidase [Rhizobium tibeticum]